MAADPSILLLQAIQSLSKTIEGLDAHIRNPDEAAQARGQQAVSTPPVRSGSSTGPDRGYPPAWTPGPQAPWASASTTASTPEKGRAEAQQRLADQAAQQALPSHPNESTPPGSQPMASGSKGQEGALEALTWQELGGVGGPLGRFRAQQYATQKYADIITPKLAGIGARMGDSAQVNQVNNLANPEGASNFQTGVNAFGARAGYGLERAANWAGGEQGTAALTALQTAYTVGSGWANEGRDLGYGSASQNAGFLGFSNPSNLFSAQSGQGASLWMEKQALEGRIPGMGFDTGMRAQDAEQTVNTLAGMGFSNQNGVSGDNLNIAENLVKPMVNQGVSVQGAADWTTALRNSNTSISELMNSLGDLSGAARATKLTTDQYNSSLLKLAQTQIHMGGTASQAAETGRAFTNATGMAPALLGTIQQNPMYQSLMMGQNGVLPSGIADLTPGAQISGVNSLLQLLGGSNGQGGAFGGLNKNHYETVGGVKMISAYGSQLEASQIAQTMGITQSEAMRLLRQQPYQRQVANAENVLGSSSAQSIDGTKGTGLWNILESGGANNWKQLSAANKAKATHVWDTGIGTQYNQLGLTAKQVKDLKGASNIRQRANMLNKDLTGNQQNNPNNQIKLGLTTQAAKLLQFSNGKSIMSIARAGGNLANTTANSPYGAAVAAGALAPVTQGFHGGN